MRHGVRSTTADMDVCSEEAEGGEDVCSEDAEGGDGSGGCGGGGGDDGKQLLRPELKPEEDGREEPKKQLQVNPLRSSNLQPERDLDAEKERECLIEKEPPVSSSTATTSSSTSKHVTTGKRYLSGSEMGCYFCSDVVAPGDVCSFLKKSFLENYLKIYFLPGDVCSFLKRVF